MRNRYVAVALALVFVVSVSASAAPAKEREGGWTKDRIVKAVKKVIRSFEMLTIPTP